MQSLVAAARLRSLLRLHRGHALARAWGAWSLMSHGRISNVDVEAYAASRAQQLSLKGPAPSTDRPGSPLVHTETHVAAALAAARAEMDEALAAAKARSDDEAAVAVAQAVAEERARVEATSAWLGRAMMRTAMSVPDRP